MYIYRIINKEHTRVIKEYIKIEQIFLVGPVRRVNEDNNSYYSNRSPYTLLEHYRITDSSCLSRNAYIYNCNLSIYTPYFSRINLKTM